LSLVKLSFERSQLKLVRHIQSVATVASSRLSLNKILYHMPVTCGVHKEAPIITIVHEPPYDWCNNRRACTSLALHCTGWTSRNNNYNVQ